VNALTIRGPFHGPTGYDRCVRGFARQLLRQGVALELQDIPGWGPTTLPAGARDPLLDSLERPLAGSRTVLQFCLPHTVERHPEKLNVNFCMFETTRVPPAWAQENRKHDLLLVPTESSRRAWLESGMAAHRIRLCPLGVDPETYSGAASPLALTLEDGTPVAGFRTRFLNVSEVVARKNLPGLLRAWIEATSRSDSAVLIVKLGCYTPGSWECLLGHLDRVERRLGKRLADAAPVAFLRGAIPDSGMPALFSAASHYVSLSFGEGWDLPMTEAAASGLRLIAPAHSAYLAYLDSEIASLIPARKTPALDPDNPELAGLYAGSCWWEPDHASAVAAIRAAIDGRDAHLRSPRERILSGFTWEHATRHLTAILDELESLRSKLPPAAMLRSNSGAATTPSHSAPGAPPDPNRS
jgi:glycosyltransferase involved in cell wall biosynthesis